MNLESVRDYCLGLKGVTEGLPFGPDTLVFKVMGKMFALVPLESETLKISLKNTPDKNQELRAEYPFIIGAYHMSKVHWNSLEIDFTVKNDLVLNLILESYELVKNSLTKTQKAEFENL
jgi:predicted DNA-binding protein (MmcQ/YjbR family)